MARAGIGPRLLRIMGVVVVAVLLLLVGVALLLQTGPVSRRVKEMVVPRASAALGRELTVQDARLRIFPRPRVALQGVALAGRPGEPPLAELQSLDVAVEAWPLIRSLGKDVRVAGIHLIRPVVNLVRARDGTWNYQGLGKGGAEAQPTTEPGAPRSSVVVRDVTIEDGSVRLIDRLGKGSAKLAITRIDLSADAVADPASGTGRVTIDKLALKGPGVDLGGNATAQVAPLPAGAQPGTAPPTKVRFAVAGPLLDLGQVMGLLPQEQKREEQKPFQLTAEQRRGLQALDVQGTVDIEKVVKGALVANDFKARAALDEGALLLRDAQASFFGGRVNAAGTRLDLSPAVPAWNLKAKLEGIDVGRALTAFTGSAPVVGKMSGSLDLDGAGVDWPTLRKALTGKGALSLKEGALTTADLGDKVLGAVAQGLRAVGKGAAAGKVGSAEGKTELRDLTAQFTVKDGALTLAKPLSFGAPFGTANLGGKIGLDGRLALQGDADIPKATLQRLVGGQGVPIPSKLSVPISLGGSLTEPAVNVNADQAVASLVTGAAKQKAHELQQGAQERVRREARRGLGDTLKKLGR